MLLDSELIINENECNFINKLIINKIRLFVHQIQHKSDVKIRTEIITHYGSILYQVFHENKSKSLIYGAGHQLFELFCGGLSSILWAQYRVLGYSANYWDFFNTTRTDTHVLLECFLPVEGVWMMEDPTYNLAGELPSGKVIGVDYLRWASRHPEGRAFLASGGASRRSEAGPSPWPSEKETPWEMWWLNFHTPSMRFHTSFPQSPIDPGMPD